MLVFGSAALVGCGEEPLDLPVVARGDDPDSLFRGWVEPELRAACGDCHFSGGDMYPVFPFDDPRMVGSRLAEVVSRLEEDQDRARAVLAWWDEVRTAP
jgi:hypothetical protein